MTPRERVEAVLRGRQVDKVPFTMYESKIPQCAAERGMRNHGLCIVNRMPVFRTHTPNVKSTQEIFYENGKQFTRTRIETPVGSLTSLREAAGFTSWSHEKYFKSPDDYKALLFLIRDEQYEPDYGAFARAQEVDGGDAIFRAGIGGEPMQSLISGGYMDMAQFCIEWMDNRDEILKLYDALVENRRRVYGIVARSPALITNYGGNVTPEVTGPEMFEEYFLPHYNEAAEVFHKHGKLLGCHFDANCRLLAELIGRTGLDYIEAFTPAPDTDMTLAEARAAWPDKVLWVNFPSSLHLKSDREITDRAFAMLEELETPDGVIMGITEDMPEERWRHSCPAIMSGLERHAREHGELYG